MKKLFIVLLLLSGMAVAQSSHGVDLSWNASVDAGASYNVYRSQVSGSGYAKINPTPVAVLLYADNNVQVGQSYFYVVRAVLNGTESINSNEAKAVILPGPPTQVTASPK